MTDVLVIGAGVNGLVCATYLAKAGLKPVVVERGARIGGSVVTSELTPGFRCPTFSHVASIVSGLGLESLGLQIVRPDAHVFSVSADGRPLVLWADRARAAREIATIAPADAERYASFLDSFARVAAVVHGVSASVPPDL